MPQAGTSLPNASLIGSLTDEETPKKTTPLDGYDALRVLTRVYRYVAHGYTVQSIHDLHARRDAEETLTRLRSEWNRELFGWDV